ncbi:bifunctional riboflavin kinase/FAD synthetase [Cyclobacterium sp. SYSU L10401]|uniref:bifunctional riboflavin kinase/FAD synthetase n=1 Tax=Cyclobacterium sp. SYSU L10401 TaxID=2678657 RepID=UPI0013D8935C|nr:bifunctional riboflavin kinase/FAD synthetase [Cyclobacterium sp. SYSU L10401]
MKIYKSLADLPQFKDPVVTIGTFDGVHLGHQKILKRVKEFARKIKGETVLVSFWPHPRMVLFPDSHGIQLLNTFDEKADLLDSFGIDHLISIPFTAEFSEMTSDDFIQEILVNKIKTKKLVIGYDHRFGKDRAGGFEHLKARQERYKFDLEEIPRQDIDDIGISSTKIRKALNTGNIGIANEFLGRPYQLEGTVVEGDKIGRTIGFPTANIRVEEADKLVPADAAYLVKVEIEEESFAGMLNIGNRPTVSGSKKSIEVHILDFQKEIYGKNIRIMFLDFLRAQKKFANLIDLKTQLEKDRQMAAKFFGKEKHDSNDK